MTGRSWLLGMGLALSALMVVALGWAALMGYGEQAGWAHRFPARWLWLALLMLNLVNLPMLVLNLRRLSRRS